MKLSDVIDVTFKEQQDIRLLIFLHNCIFFYFVKPQRSPVVEATVVASDSLFYKVCKIRTISNLF